MQKRNFFRIETMPPHDPRLSPTMIRQLLVPESYQRGAHAQCAEPSQAPDPRFPVQPSEPGHPSSSVSESIILAMGSSAWRFVIR